MNILILGASGATGRLLVRQLLDQGNDVSIVIRAESKVFNEDNTDEKLNIIRGNILELQDSVLIELLKDCDAVVSCLGHNLSFKGIYGQPRKLVLDATCKICDSLQEIKSEKTVKFILMSSSGVSNLDLSEKVSIMESFLISILRKILPPHRDNEDAANYLRTKIGQNNELIQWVTVRPDTLIDNTEVSEIKAFPSPIRSALFNPGKTSRINVAAFMTQLILDAELWETWQGQMPVIYNEDSLN